MAEWICRKCGKALIKLLRGHMDILKEKLAVENGPRWRDAYIPLLLQRLG